MEPPRNLVGLRQASRRARGCRRDACTTTRDDRSVGRDYQPLVLVLAAAAVGILLDWLWPLPPWTWAVSAAGGLTLGARWFGPAVQFSTGGYAGSRRNGAGGAGRPKQLAGAHPKTDGAH